MVLLGELAQFAGGEAGRTARQNEFLIALLSKMGSLEILPKIPVLIPQFKEALITDLSLEQLASFACLSAKLEKESVAFYGLEKPGLVTESIPNEEAVIDYLDEIFSE